MVEEGHNHELSAILCVATVPSPLNSSQRYVARLQVNVLQTLLLCFTAYCKLCQDIVKECGTSLILFFAAGLNECMNTQDCLGQHRVCSHEKQELKGECVCEKGYELISPNSFACAKKGI